MKSSFACCLAIILASGSLANAKTSMGTPVERVVKLLKDMHSKLGQDQKVEQKIYDKYACWCETTTERKAKDIEDLRSEIRMLGQKILEMKGKIEILTNEIEQLEREIKDNLEAQEKATAMREKENKAYMAEQEETKEAIAALEQAIIVLRDGVPEEKEGGSALLQQRLEAQVKLLRRVVVNMPDRIILEPEQVEHLRAFLETGHKYTPQSGMVQGILKNMYDTFAKDLESMTFEEGVSNRDYENFMHTKAMQLAQLRKTKAEKEAEKAETEEKLATTQEEFDDAQVEMEATIKFFDETVAACKAKHDEWVDRKQLRVDEMDGIQQALDILTTDAARDLFAKSIDESQGKQTGVDANRNTGVDITSPVFLQVASSDEGMNSASARAASQRRAYNSIKAVAKLRKGRGVQFAELAIAARIAKAGHFDGVIKQIDDMMADLKAEAAADVEKYDQCKEELFKTEKKIKQVSWLIKNNEIKIKKIETEIENLWTDVNTTNRLLNETREEMIQMTKDRTAENLKFLGEKKDDQDSIKLLLQARDVLAKYYNDNEIKLGKIQGGVKDAMIQKKAEPEFKVSADQAPDATFKDKGSRKYEAKGIVQILTYIIENQNDEIKNDIAAEEQAQLDYEAAMAAAKAYEGKLILKIIDLKDAIADQEELKTAEKKKLAKNQFDLNDEETYRASIKPDCDWVIKAFHTRAESRAAEMKGLEDAKTALSEWAHRDKKTYTQESDSDLAATYGLIQKGKAGFLANRQ